MSDTESLSFVQKVTTWSSITASDSLFPGTHLHSLGEYLQKSNRSLSPVVSRDSARGYPSIPARHGQAGFAALLDLHQPDETIWLDTPDDLETALTGKDEPSTQLPPARILFMHGWPSPEWLNQIGQTFDLDPSFFENHLRSLSGPEFLRQVRSQHATLVESEGFQIRLNSIIRTSHNEYGMLDNAHHFLPCLAKHKVKWHAYQQSARLEHEHRPGTSIIRNCSLHSIGTLSVEQAITVSAKPYKAGWIGLIWSDIGSDVGEIIDQAWFGRDGKRGHMQSTLSCQPTIITPLESDIGGWGGDEGHGTRKQPLSVPQSVRHLATHYAGLMQPDAAVRDPFQALSGVLYLAKHSKSSYLDFLGHQIQSILKNEAEFVVAPEVLMIAQRSLSEVEDDLVAAVHTLENHVHKAWPTYDSSSSANTATDSDVSSLLREYKDLLDRNERLSRRCEQALHNVMSRASIEESRKAMRQAQSVESVTRLAFVFIPLSFVSTFFGMNFKQLGMQGALPIWVWFAIAVPTLVFSVVYTSSAAHNCIRDVKSRLSRSKAASNSCQGDW